MKKIKLSENYFIKEMTLKDIPFYNRIRNECSFFLHDNTIYSLKDCKKWFIKNNPRFFVLIHGKVKIGYFRTSNWHNNSVFVGLDLHKDYRGKGHAKKSYVLFLDYLRNKYKINDFFLRVLKSNTRAKYIYDQLGFVVIEETNIDFKMELK